MLTALEHIVFGSLRNSAGPRLRAELKWPGWDPKEGSSQQLCLLLKLRLNRGAWKVKQRQSNGRDLIRLTSEMGTVWQRTNLWGSQRICPPDRPTLTG